MVASDRSFKKEWGTAALIIEGKQYTKHRITATCTTPGLPKYQDAYRSEILGLLHSIMKANRIFKKLT